MSSIEFDHLDLDEGFVKVPGKRSHIVQNILPDTMDDNAKQACEPEFCVSMPGLSPLHNMTTRIGKN